MIKILLLNADEAMLLVSRIKNDDRDFETQTPIAKVLLLKLFSIFNELVKDGELRPGESPLGATEKELWLMRQCVEVGDKSPKGKNIGIPLLRKIHQLLIELNSELGLEAGPIEEPKLTPGEVKEYIGLFESLGREEKSDEANAGSDNAPAGPDENSHKKG